MRLSTGNVFGSSRKDFIIFVVPVLLATLFAYVSQGVGPAEAPALYYPALVFLFDTPHLVCGFWVMLGRTATPTPLQIKLWAILLFLAISFTWLLWSGYEEYAITFMGLVSIWHFIKQHQAWFFLAMRGDTTQSVWFSRINRLGIWSVTWGFFLVGQCSSERIGWYEINDIFLLPEEIKIFLLSLVLSASAVYMVYHAHHIYRNKIIPISGHLIWLTAVVVWGCSRLMDNSYLTPALIIIPHTVAYMYLLQRFVKAVDRPARVWVLWTTYLAGAAWQGYRYLPLVLGQERFQPDWDHVLIMTITAGHFLHDKLHWNSVDNPGWGRAVGRVDSTRVV